MTSCHQHSNRLTTDYNALPPTIHTFSDFLLDLIAVNWFLMWMYSAPAAWSLWFVKCTHLMIPLVVKVIMQTLIQRVCRFLLLVPKCDFNCVTESADQLCWLTTQFFRPDGYFIWSMSVLGSTENAGSISVWSENVSLCQQIPVLNWICIKCAHIWVFCLREEAFLHIILAHTGLTQSMWMNPIKVLLTEMTLAAELHGEHRTQEPVPVVWEFLQYLHYSLAQEQKCARTDCDEGFRQAGESSISHYLAWLVGVWWRGGGFAPSLHGKPLDVYPLQLISHSQQIRHIRCCFGRGHQSG